MVEDLTEREKNFFKDHGLVILKPDAIDLFLDNLFIQDLEHLGLMVNFRQLLQFTTENMRFIYPEWVHHPEKFEAIVHNMTDGPSMLLIFESQIETGDDDLHHYVRQIKAHADQPGLRRKYIHIFEDELRVRYTNEKEFLRELNKNRIHSPENANEALRTLSYLWKFLDRDKLKCVLPTLYDIMSSKVIPVKSYAT